MIDDGTIDALKQRVQELRGEHGSLDVRLELAYRTTATEEERDSARDGDWQVCDTWARRYGEGAKPMHEQQRIEIWDMYWEPVTASLPREGERVLVATPSTVMIGVFIGMEADEPTLPAFIGTNHFAIFGVTHWAKLPSVPQVPTVGQHGAAR